MTIDHLPEADQTNAQWARDGWHKALRRQDFAAVRHFDNYGRKLLGVDLWRTYKKEGGGQ